jgi:hypothetical protein
MTQEQYDSGKENDGSCNNTVNSKNAVNNSAPGGGNSVVFNTNYNTNDLYESPSIESSSLATEIARSRQLQEQTQISVQISETAKIEEYDGYYSDNDKIGVGNTLEEQKKLYDLENKKRDIISAKLGVLTYTYCIYYKNVYIHLNAIFI